MYFRAHCLALSTPFPTDCKGVANGTAERAWCGTCVAEDDGDTCGEIVGGIVGASVILVAIAGGILFIIGRRPDQQAYGYTAVGDGIENAASPLDHEMGFGVPNTRGTSVRDAMLNYQD